jgi:aminoglycoside phosphotransferase (APT) family kinase protein
VTSGAIVEDLAGWKAHVAARAPDWFPELAGGAIAVETVGHHRRRLSTAVVLRVGRAETWRRVVVKHDTRSDGLTRPRPRPTEDALVKHVTEWRALCLLHERVHGDHGLRAVRPLEHVADRGAIVMEWVASTSLRQHLGPVPRLATPVGQVELLERTGRLVRHLHDLPAPAGTAVRPPGPGLDTYVDYLSAHGADRVAVRALRELAPVVAARLPCGPVGLQHGDLAPRNLLVDPTGAVAMIDMFGRDRVPVAEDLAYLRCALRLAMHPLRGGEVPGAVRGWRRAERDLLRGYLGAESDDAAIDRLVAWIDVHEVPVLVDQWTALAADREARGGLPPRRRWKLRLVRATLDDAMERVRSGDGC